MLFLRSAEACINTRMQCSMRTLRLRSRVVGATPSLRPSSPLLFSPPPRIFTRIPTCTYKGGREEARSVVRQPLALPGDRSANKYDLLPPTHTRPPSLFRTFAAPPPPPPPPLRQSTQIYYVGRILLPLPFISSPSPAKRGGRRRKGGRNSQ